VIPAVARCSGCGLMAPVALANYAGYWCAGCKPRPRQQGVLVQVSVARLESPPTLIAAQRPHVDKKARLSPGRPRKYSGTPAERHVAAQLGYRARNSHFK
jgi:hypothetical protein